MCITKSVCKNVELNSKNCAYEYHIKQSLNQIDGLGTCMVYGIMIKSEINGMKDYSHIQDISSNPEIVERLFETIVKLNLSPLHLKDVVEDYIT